MRGVSGELGDTILGFVIPPVGLTCKTVTEFTRSYDTVYDLMESNGL